MSRLRLIPVIRVAVDHLIAGDEIGSGWTSVLLSQPEDVVEAFLAERPRLTPTAASVVGAAAERLSPGSIIRWSSEIWNGFIEAQGGQDCAILAESIFGQLIRLEGDDADVVLTANRWGLSPFLFRLETPRRSKIVLPQCRLAR